MQQTTSLINTFFTGTASAAKLPADADHKQYFYSILSVLSSWSVIAADARIMGRM